MILKNTANLKVDCMYVHIDIVVIIEMLFHRTNITSAKLATENPPCKHLATSDYSFFVCVRRVAANTELIVCACTHTLSYNTYIPPSLYRMLSGLVVSSTPMWKTAPMEEYNLEQHYIKKGYEQHSYCLGNVLRIMTVAEEDWSIRVHM